MSGGKAELRMYICTVFWLTGEFPGKSAPRNKADRNVCSRNEIGPTEQIQSVWISTSITLSVQYGNEKSYPSAREGNGEWGEGEGGGSWKSVKGICKYYGEGRTKSKWSLSVCCVATKAYEYRINIDTIWTQSQKVMWSKFKKNKIEESRSQVMVNHNWRLKWLKFNSIIVIKMYSIRSICNLCTWCVHICRHNSLIRSA